MIQNMHEVFQYPFERDTIDPNFSMQYIKNLIKESRKAKVMNILDGHFVSKNIKKVDYVFFGINYLDIINNLQDSTKLVIGGVKNKKTILMEDSNSYFPIYYFLPKLLKIYHLDPLMKKKSTEIFILEIVLLFKNLSAKYLVLPNDSLFLERFLIFCAKKAGMKTICIQHGLVQSVSNPIILDGKYADLMYVWSEKQKNIFIESGVLPTKLHVLGYPHNIVNLNRPLINKKKLNICIFGQPWEKYNMTLGMKKKEIFEQMKAYLPMHNILYKRHPGEVDLNFIPKDIQIYKGDLYKSLYSFDIFISFTSTALIEASLYGRIAIQLYDEKFQCDSFEELGYCYTFPSNKLAQIDKFIENIQYSYEMPQNAIKRNNDLGDAFLSLIEKIQ